MDIFQSLNQVNPVSPASQSTDYGNISLSPVPKRIIELIFSIYTRIVSQIDEECDKINDTIKTILPQIKSSTVSPTSKQSIVTANERLEKMLEKIKSEQMAVNEIVNGLALQRLLSVGVLARIDRSKSILIQLTKNLQTQQILLKNTLEIIA